METATIANGCFWCTEAIFKRLKGVASVTSGYANSSIDNPSYEEVCTGNTNAAEAIRIEFDPSVLPYAKLLEIFWHTHNPTTLNQQGNDMGTQYRSAVFYHDDKQKEIAEKVKKEISESGTYKDPIVTAIEPLTNFFPAEGYHKDYYDRNKHAPYCMFVIDPKIKKLLERYSNDVKDEYKK